MSRPGIRRRLVLLLSVSMALVWAGMLAWRYLATREEVAEQADARLEEGARTIMLLDLPKLAALASAPSGDDDDDDLQLRFQVWDREGKMRLPSRGAPDVGFTRDAGHRMIMHHRYAWHTYAMRDPADGYQVRVFERPGVRGKLVNERAQQMAQVLLVGLPLLPLLAWISIGIGLRPLRPVSGAIALRDAGKLDPIDLAGTPVEVQPLVDALNRLLLRLSASMAHERAFTADAAHELRTPLAAIDPATQARLRDRFYRAEGNAAEGSGLGLSIVDKIAQAYGARLELGPGLDGDGFGAAVRWR